MRNQDRPDNYRDLNHLVLKLSFKINNHPFIAKFQQKVSIFD